MEETYFQQRVDLSGLSKATFDIRNEIGKVIIGQHKMVDLLLIGLLCDGHLLIEGVPESFQIPDSPVCQSRNI